MALTVDDIDMIKTLIAEVYTPALPPTSAGSYACTADNPHDTLSFQRGPMLYRCRCGKLYLKDGKGGLRDA